VADAVYWMNRYVERAENVARLVDVTFHLGLDVPESAASHWAALVLVTGDEPLFRSRHGVLDERSVLRFLTFDRDYPSSVVSCLTKARENALRSREIISSEMWQQINETYLLVRDAESAFASAPEDATPYVLFAAVRKACQGFVGTTYLTMSHDEAWHFGRLGRLMERAEKTSRIVDMKSYMLQSDASDKVPSFAAQDVIEWTALLKSASAFEMYRKRHGLFERRKVIDFLVLDRKFPRSIFYCVRKAERSLHAITGTPLDARATRAEREIGRLHADLEFAEVEEILSLGLHAHLDGLQRKLNAVGDAISETFFWPPPAP
jgi:uncharacterized alpha-E superfamily protein